MQSVSGTPTGSASDRAARLKRAELTSAIGALVLGTGLGAVLAPYLAPSATLVLGTGLLLHAWGMYDKHRLERGTEAESVRYAAALYWICWALLAVVVGYVVLRMLR